jgi:hypothetical protein
MTKYVYDFHDRKSLMDLLHPLTQPHCMYRCWEIWEIFSVEAPRASAKAL